MKNIRFLTLATLLVFFTIACKNSGKQSINSIEVPTKQELKEFADAAEKVAGLLQPKTATLIFTLDGTTYRLATTDVKATIIPFAHFKPADAEEGETHGSSLIWMQGTDTDNKVEIVFSISLDDKFANGNFVANEGKVILSKEGKDNYYSIKNMMLNIHNLKEKKFGTELSAYSLDMTFGGTIAEFGASGKINEIKEGKYNLRY